MERERPSKLNLFVVLLLLVISLLSRKELKPVQTALNQSLCGYVDLQIVGQSSECVSINRHICVKLGALGASSVHNVSLNQPTTWFWHVEMMHKSFLSPLSPRKMVVLPSNVRLIEYHAIQPALVRFVLEIL